MPVYDDYINFKINYAFILTKAMNNVQTHAAQGTAHSFRAGECCYANLVPGATNIS